MAEANDLSPERTEKLIQFQDLTGIDDMERCRELLERHNWDIEVAVQDRFNEEEGNPNMYEELQAPREERAPTVNLNPTDQRIYTISRRQPPRGILGWGYFVVLFPFRFVYSTVMDILRFAFRLLRPDPRRNVTDPVGDVVAFIRNYEEKYGPIHPTLYQGSYSQVLNDAKRELKFCLVYLHGDDHQDSPVFCQETLSDSALIEFINTRMLFWACNTNSPEGYRVSQALRENTYPFLALIVLRDNKMTVVARIEGPIGAEELIRRLTRIMEENETSLIVARADREERSFNQSLREQQDAAYLESLRVDQEKERKKREEIEQKEREIQDAEQRELDEQKKLQDIALRKEQLRNEIPEEPAKSDPDAIAILLKMPDGSRIERRFLRTQSLKHLHNFVFCHEDAPDDFQIVTNFPRRILECQSEITEPQTFEEAGLGKSEMLFVQDNEA